MALRCAARSCGLVGNEEVGPIEEDADKRDPTMLPPKLFADPQTTWSMLLRTKKEERVFFDRLEICSNGGMSEIGIKEELWYPTRYITAMALVAFCLYNSYLIVVEDLKLILPPPDAPPPEWLISAYAFWPIMAHYGIKANRPQQILGGLELAYVVFMWLVGFYYMLRICCCRGFKRWRSVIDLCWNLMPDLAKLSSMSLLRFVVPQTFLFDLNDVLFYNPTFCNKVFFFVSRPLILIIGTDCFLVKFRAVAKFADPDPPTAYLLPKNVIPSLVFMNQVLGVVMLAKTLRFRLYRFIFGGEDGIMQPEERVRQDVWEAMVGQLIIERYNCRQGLAVLLTWCDDDFQLLALDECAETN